MRWLFSIGIIVVLAFQCLYLPLVSVYLESNRAKIAEQYCIYKYQPELMCAGSCYINTTLEEAIELSNSIGTIAEYEGYLPLPLFHEVFDNLIISVIPTKNPLPFGSLLGLQELRPNSIYSPPWV